MRELHRRVLFPLFLALLAWGTQPHAMAAAAARGGTPLMLRLSAAGFANGIAIDAAKPRATWYQALPQHTRIREGTLILNIVSGFDARQRIGIRVNINGSPRSAFHPAATSAGSPQHTLHIALEPADLEKETATIEFIFEALEQTNQHRCRDIDPTNFMRVLPDSVLALIPSSERTSGIGAYLEQLPNQVDLAIPAQAGIGAIHAAWHVSAMLRQRGHAVRIRTHPQSGHIVVANAAQWPAAAKHGQAGARDMQLIATPEGQTLFVADTLAAQGTALNLTALMRLDRFSLRAADRAPVWHRMVPLSGVLSTPPHQETFGSVQWEGYLSSRQVPRGWLPSGMSLRLIANPSKRSNKASLHVFIDDVLIKTAGLRADGSPEGVEIAFPRSHQRDGIRIRLRIDDDGRSLRCLADAGSPVQLLQESVIKLESGDPPAPAERNFTHLGRSFFAPFSVYLDASAMQNAAATIGILSRLTERFDAQPGRASLAVAGKLDAHAEAADFVWISTLPPDGASSSLSIAGDILRVKDHSGTYALPMAELRGMSVAALVRRNARLGLWLRPGEASLALNVPDSLAFGDGDVAFYDDRAVVLTTNHFPAGGAVSKITEAAYVKPLLNKFNWFGAALWIALALLLAGGTRLVLRRRRK
jgi:hypothetical protein